VLEEAAGVMDLYRISTSDIEKARSVLAESFRDDPFFTYMLGERRGDPAFVKRIHGFTLAYGVANGIVLAPSQEIEGAAIWLPPGRTSMTAWRSIRAGVGRMMGMPFGSLAGRTAFARKMIAYSGFSTGLHKRHAPFPHWYLLAIGVAEVHRGKGLASRLIRPMLERLDAEGMPCYLETHNPANVGLYEHFGFTVAEVGKLPGSEARHWAMLRLPRGER
jgi:ribosomal protein S18 acetylase RimI-like enzyme